MLEKIYEQTNLLSQSLDQVLALAVSVTDTRMVLIQRKSMLLPRDLRHVLFVHGDVRHYKSNFLLKGHYDSLLCSNCHRPGHVEDGCRFGLPTRSDSSR